jgi:hypothetical protein
MANSSEITRYKQQIMSLFINDNIIVDLIDNLEIENSEDLIGENIYNFLRVPEAPEEEKTTICIEVDIPDAQKSSYNNLFKKLVTTIYITTHERLMPTEYGGTRTDLLSAEIDKLLTDAEDIGFGKLKLLSNNANGIGVKHRCRIMTFTTYDLKNGCDV